MSNNKRIEIADASTSHLNRPGESNDQLKPGTAARRLGAPQSSETKGKWLRRTITPGLGKARGIEARIRRFSPSWFSVTMGSGIPSNLLYLMPWASTHAAFRGIGAAFLIFDMALFGFFSSMFIARYILYPQIFPATLRHETHSLYLGVRVNSGRGKTPLTLKQTIPMGLVTLSTAIANYGAGYKLNTAIAASVLFWIAMVLSIFAICVVPFYMMTRHSHKQEGLTASWLLPFVPPLTVAAAGSTISSYLIEKHPVYACDILLASYVMLGVGSFTAFSFLVLYIQRLTLHHLPDKEVIVSTFLPLGACGQSGFAALQLGRVAMSLFPIMERLHPDAPAWQIIESCGSSFYGVGVLFALLMFGYGFWFAFLAVSSIGSHYLKKSEQPQKAVFNLGFWSTTFPTGSLNLLTYALGTAFDNMFFKVLGTVLTVLVVIFWAAVIVPTMRGFKRGSLFDAPCLENIAEDEHSLSRQLNALAPEEVPQPVPLASEAGDQFSRNTSRTTQEV